MSLHVLPLGVPLPGDGADHAGHEAVQGVVVTLNHRGGTGQTSGKLGTRA